MADTKNYVTKEEFDKYKKEVQKHLGPKIVRAPRPPNEYNLFMKDKIAEFKKEDSTISNKDAFKKGAEAWRNKKETSTPVVPTPVAPCAPVAP